MLWGEISTFSPVSRGARCIGCGDARCQLLGLPFFNRVQQAKTRPRLQETACGGGFRKDIREPMSIALETIAGRSFQPGLEK